MWLSWLLMCFSHSESKCFEFLQKKKEEESAREKELNELFKVAISQPKVPVGMLSDSFAQFCACVDVF